MIPLTENQLAEILQDEDQKNYICYLDGKPYFDNDSFGCDYNSFIDSYD